MQDILRITPEQQSLLLNRKLKERVALTMLCDESNAKHVLNREVAKKLCADPKEGFKYWCNNFVFIQNPRSSTPEEKDIPFLLYDYQERASEEIIKAVFDGYDLPIEKSRDMGLSWLLIAIIVWGWHFHEWEALLGSQKAENVDTRGNIKSLMEKARFILYRMPGWLIPRLQQGLHDKSMLLLHPMNKTTIAGESNNANFGRSDRRKVILFDEFSSWELTDRAAWQSCSATTRCRIPLSTPNTRGTNCYFYTIVQDAKKKNKPYLSLHWSLHPEFGNKLFYDELGKPHSPWYDSEVRRATSMQEVYQELDIDYEASMAGLVFPDFDYEKQVIDNLEYDEDLPLYCAWDFGLDTTAILWIQPDKKNGTYNIIDEYQNDGKGAGTDIYHYLDVVESKDYKRAVHFGDPHSGGNKNLTSGQSISDIMRRSGYLFRSQRTRIPLRVAAGRNILKQVRVSPRCPFAIEMFSSWQMKKGIGIPDHSAYSHIGEAFTYFAWNYKNNNVGTQQKTSKATRRYTPTASGVMN